MYCVVYCTLCVELLPRSLAYNGGDSWELLLSAFIKISRQTKVGAQKVYKDVYCLFLTSSARGSGEVCLGTVADEPVPARCALTAVMTWIPRTAHSALVPLSLAPWPH